MDRPQVGVVGVLMPAQQELSLGLDPVDLVVVVPRAGLHIEPDFETPCLRRVVRGL